MRSSITQHVSFYARSGCSIGSVHKAPARFTQIRCTSSNSPKRSSGYRIGLAACLAIGTAAAGVYFTQGTSSAKLNPQSFTPYTLRSKERVSSTASIFTLVPLSSVSKEDPYRELWKRSLWSVQAKQPQLQIARNYTPLPPSAKQTEVVDPAAFRILIRHEVNGEMSGYLHRLPLNATIDLRGPYEHLKLDSSVTSVVFCAGGTGIAPAIQCAYALLASHDAADLPKMHILWANRKRDECEGGVSDTIHTSGKWGSRWSPAPPARQVQAEKIEKSAIVRELDALKERFAGRLTVDYFVDEERSSIGKGALQESPALSFAKRVPEAEAREGPLILVSGPDGFISYIAGPKRVQDGLEVQGPVGGLLKDLVKGADAKVWKL